MNKTSYTLFAFLCMAIPTPSSAASVTGTIVEPIGADVYLEQPSNLASVPSVPSVVKRLPGHGR